MSAALDNFNAYITARKTAADTYITNKKAQVDALNVARKAEVDASNLNNSAKTQVKALLDNYTTDIKGLFDTTGADVKGQLLDVFIVKGEDYYVRVVKEYAAHLRKHVAAFLADGADAATCDLLDEIAEAGQTEGDSTIIAFAKALNP